MVQRLATASLLYPTNASIICLFLALPLLYPQLNAILHYINYNFALYIHNATASGTVSVSNHVYSLSS